jgi:hypothetical protein
MHGCNGLATVASSTPTTATVVEWAGDRVQQSKNQISEFPQGHPYLFLISLLRYWIAHRAVPVTCYARFERQRNESKTCAFLFINSLLLYMYDGHPEGHDGSVGRSAWWPVVLVWRFMAC